MYAVIDIGSFQFKVQEGDLIEAPGVTQEAGQSLDVSSVLLVANGEDIRVGDPFVKGAKVTLQVVKHFRGDKTIAFRFRRRKNSQKTTGHRAELASLKVAKISA
ncbi:MAG: 50S ribosomal protein L21 [Candidatus Omnitrophica bacterium]|nr:50S ribosomal protein L21 [Candidatus Omnitrophota bacterium]